MTAQTQAFDLPEMHQMLRDTVRKFAESEIAPVARALDEKGEFSESLTRKMGELGLFGIIVPEEYGGHGMDYLAYAVVCEEIARIDGSQAATITAHNSLGISPLYYFGNAAQRKKYLPQLCTGEKLWAFGLTEPGAGSDSRGSKTTAKKVDGGWVINGAKIFITNGATRMNAGVTVQAVTGSKGEGKPELSCFIVEAGSKGFTARAMHGKLMWRASDTSELYFDDVFVPDENLLGKQGDGSKQMLATLDRGKLGIAAMGVGCAQGAYEKALAYAKERRQFNQPIARFQSIAFALADMHMKIELARTYLYKACWLADTGKPFTKEAAMAKLYSSEIAGEVSDMAVQIHGGYGLMEEYDVARFWRDHRLLRIGEGTSEIQRLIISRLIGCAE
ncbi:MAG: acyl-CoA dehydrogenase family protein [Alphaproteobacteria bacterium]|nr:acyl-CoA dehydrogenase family protein [Alphaproteobacteria bacterium]